MAILATIVVLLRVSRGFLYDSVDEWWRGEEWRGRRGRRGGRGNKEVLTAGLGLCNLHV